MKSIQDTIDNYLARGQIRPSPGNNGILIIVIQKKTGKLRVVIDYRLLNKQTRFDQYPILCIDKFLDCLARAKYFSKIDLMSGYHQIKMADGHKDKTAFLIRYSIYLWLVLPLRLINAPATFQRLMNGISRDLFDKTLFVYLDDQLVYSDVDIQHLEDVKHILQHLHDNKLKAKKKKCNFNAQQVEYLGHIVSNGAVVMDPSKYQRLKNCPFL